MKIKQIIIVILVALLVLSGCSSYRNDYVIDAKTYFNITVPNDSAVSFQTIWYRISKADYNNDDFLKDTYIVGNNVKLYGQNVEQLDGAQIYLRQYNLKDGIDSSFYENILREEDYMYDTNKYKLVDNEFVYPTEAEIQNAKKLLEPYINTGKVLVCNMSFSGSITKQVQVESVNIAGLDFTFNFDTFMINPTELPKDQNEEINKVYTPSSLGGVLAGPSLSKIGYCLIEGKAIENIKEIKVISLNSICEMVTEENYRDYGSFEEENGVKLYKEQKTTDFKKGDDINIEYDYLFEGVDAGELKKLDVVIASIGTVFTLNDGTKLYKYLYQPSMRAAEYALVHILHEIH